ncbi:hypothetical protein AVEN_63099-1 [Araneus ventricosus]|uniref:DUF4817 domain-containing protein n=1 Tax=Araneus ventricosus TaxID=182803 RepID=A0A4Y2VAE5_ARAVE|nr:hypothetical protein AVEN_22044-1 [Araneus ventricosus]GBO21536.1 hypothetical protein AVEN_43614-1 [Araneus ventricosus]GBO21538.1 hypothetical protein AVEN_62160-1 [Araneus ventricosus]GBO21540.1 hypothetical protein AVEN_63099-1 [Araneus ventricosus]
MYFIEQRVFLVLEYHRLERSPTVIRCSFQKRFNVPKGPDANTIRKIFSKFERTGSVDDNRVGNVGPRHTVVTPENVAKVSRIVQQNPRNSIRRDWFEAFKYAKNIEKMPTDVSMQNPKSSGHTHKSCATKV